MFKVKKRGIEATKRKYAYLFVTPFIFGVILFVLIPLIQCLSYSFSDVKMTAEGLERTFVGIKYYKHYFFKDPNYLDLIAGSMSSLFTSIPIVMALSLVLALILNQKFKGRLFARAVFFLPVIIASGAVMSVLSSFNMQQSMTATDGGKVAEYMQVIDFQALLDNLNLPTQISSLISGYLNDTFNLIWSCGVQILLFVAGLQTIPEQLYEVGKVEGITAWEEFWFVTVPMLGRIILLVLFYSMVELFISKSSVVNVVITQIDKQNFTNASAMIWPYFLIVGVVIGIVVIIYNQLCLKRWE